MYLLNAYSRIMFSEIEKIFIFLQECAGIGLSTPVI